MKKLVGGDYLLDLTPIELEESEDGETYTSITNKEIIEQLTNLKKFVANPSMVKPVWVKLINGETDEIVVVRGEFKVVDANEFEIVVAIDGYKLKIHIEFTQVTLSDDTPIDDWYIDTNDAKYLFTSDAQNVKATIEDADFGDVALAGDLSIGGNLSVTGKINNVENPSVKPIYFHGIELYGETDQNALEMHILNNSPTPFTSIAGIKAWAEGIDGAVRIQCNGKIKVSGAWYPIILLYKGSNNTYDLYYCKSDDGNAYISNVSLETKFDSSVIDAVNKIN